MKKLVILGGGYGGMRILQKLLNQLPENRQIILVDKVPYHCFKTEFYALAAGTVADDQVRVPFPQHPQLEFINDEVTKIDIENEKVHLLKKGTLSYDDLIIALGCEDKYHNVPGADEYTCSIQSIESTRKTYQTLCSLPKNSTVAIVGAGLSGVEIASELHESRPDLKISIFDRGNVVLSKFPEKLSKYVEEWFRDHGVQIVNNANITKVEKGVLYNHDQPIAFDCVVWTAGIRPNKVVREMNVEKDGQDRIVLTPHHNIPGYENVYVVGDCASLPHAPSAQLAEAQGDQIVDVILKRWKNEELPELPEIKLKGILGSLGKKHGFGLVNEVPLTGRVPRLLKSGVLWLYRFHNG